MPRLPHATLVLVAGWIVPGGGHLLLGRRTQAGVFFLAITGTFLFGMYLADFTNVSFERHPYYFAAHVWNGGAAFLAAALTRDLVAAEVPRHFGLETFDVGMLYTAVAALLNVMAVTNAWAIQIARRTGAPEPGLPAAEAPAEEPS